MKFPQMLVALALALALQVPALAQDAGSPIKSSVILKTSRSWDGAPLAYPAGQAEVTGLVIEIAPGAETGWHLHPVPSFAFVLQGELDVRLKDGTVGRLKSGDAVAEVVNTLHNGKNVGTSPVKLVVFYTGVVGDKLTEPAKPD